MTFPRQPVGGKKVAWFAPANPLAEIKGYRFALANPLAEVKGYRFALANPLAEAKGHRFAPANPLACVNGYRFGLANPLACNEAGVVGPLTAYLAIISIHGYSIAFNAHDFMRYCSADSGGNQLLRKYYCKNIY